MTVISLKEPAGTDDGFPLNGGRTGALIRGLNWSLTSLGPISSWPQSLKTTVQTLLHSPVPIVLLWGPDGVMIYNDAYSVFAGGRHPHLLGSKVREGWPEVADFNDHVMKVGLSGGTLSYRDQELTLYRKGIPEQVWMNLDYSPVLDEAGGPAGVLAIVVETTERVLAQRALSRAEERLSHALKASGMIGTFDWHITSDKFYSDERFATMFSVDPEKGVSGAPLSNYLAGIHPDDRAAIAGAVERALATGEKYVQQYRVIGLDGRVRWIEARGECLYDEEGKPWRFPGVAVDITEHKRAEEALRESEERRRMASEAAQIGVWDYDLITGTLRWDERTKALFGLSAEAPVDYDVFLAALHPEDRAATDAAVQKALDPNGAGQYSIEYRTVGREDGITRWLAANGKCYFAHGRAVRFIGTVLDIGATKEAQERQRLLLREMNHRVKNLFSVVHGLIRLSARSARTPEELAQSLAGRLDALMRAKDLVRPGIAGTQDAPNDDTTTVDALVRTILLPYVDAESGDRIAVSGPAISVGARGVTSLALVLHEMATNAAKYGALSRPEGSVRVRWEAEDDELRLDWQEEGGPAIEVPPQGRGFGTILAERSIAGELGGRIERDWRPSGLRLRLSIPLDCLSERVS